MKVALLRFQFGYLMGLVDDEHAGLVMAASPAADEEDAPAVQITLRYPAEPQPSVMMIPGKVTLDGQAGQVVPQGVCLPVWLHVKQLRVYCEEAVAGDVFELDDDAPLVVSYLRSLQGVGIMTETGQTRVKTGRS